MGVQSAGSSNLPISQLINNPNALPNPASSGTGDLGPQAFLQLLTTELQNQDPTQPQDPTQQVTQLAQFSALQSQTTLSQQFTNFQSTFSVLQTAQLINHQVTVVNTDPTTGNSSNLTGTVNAIDVANGAPTFTLVNANGQPITDANGNAIVFSPSQIVGIGGASGSSASSGSAPAGVRKIGG